MRHCFSQSQTPRDGYFITQDRTREMFHWGVVGGALTTLSFAIVLPWGPIAMAAAYSLTSCFVKQPILFWFVGRRGPVRSRDFYLAMSLPLSLAASVGVVLAGFRLWGAPTDPVAGLILAMILAVTISLGVLASLTAGRRVLHDLFALAFDGMSPVIQSRPVPLGLPSFHCILDVNRQLGTRRNVHGNFFTYPLKESVSCLWCSGY